LRTSATSFGRQELFDVNSDLYSSAPFVYAYRYTAFPPEITSAPTSNTSKHCKTGHT
jgi:hypothetical protein